MGISITNNIHGCLSSVYRNSISISKCFHIICKDLIHKTFSAIIVEKFVSGDAIYVNTSTRDRGAAMDFMSAMSMMVSLLLTYITSPDRYFSTMVFTLLQELSASADARLSPAAENQVRLQYRDNGGGDSLSEEWKIFGV